MMRQEAGRRVLPRVLGLSALFSGVALVTHILSGVSLRLAFVAFAGLLILAVGAIWRRASTAERKWLVGLTRVGVVSGTLATAAYDLTKFALSQLDPSPYNPFETIRAFGILLAGPTAPQAGLYLAGTAFHLLNGVAFGIAYCFLLARHGVGAGIAWGLILELFQLTLFPGWLDIRLYREFVQISSVSHVVYGTVLGLVVQRDLRKAGLR